MKIQIYTTYNNRCLLSSANLNLIKTQFFHAKVCFSIITIISSTMHINYIWKCDSCIVHNGLSFSHGTSISNFNLSNMFCQGQIALLMYLPLQNLCISATRSLHSLILQKYSSKSMPELGIFLITTAWSLGRVNFGYRDIIGAGWFNDICRLNICSLNWWMKFRGLMNETICNEMLW
jgi:hypothetical protein